MSNEYAQCTYLCDVVYMKAQKTTYTWSLNFTVSRDFLYMVNSSMEPVWATEQRGNERVFKYQFRPLKRQKKIFFPNLFAGLTSKSYHFKGPDFQKNPKDKRIKNYKIFVWKINSSTSILYSKKSNPKQKSFWYFFISKKGTCSPKKIFAQLSLLKIIDVFDQSAAFPFKMS